jgi:3-hexulose-6-phosphate synthase/6-phospho-3-hexuloisomerase
MGTVQISLDCPTVEEALRITKVAVDAGTLWLEAGTGLLLGSGLEGVRALRRAFPNHVIVADTKIMDGGYPLVQWPGEAGADYAVVMAAAGEHVIREALRWRAEGGTKIMVDTMYQPDQVSVARRLEAMGVDMIVLHLGSDERAVEQHRRAIDPLPAVRAAVKIPIQVVGGLSLDDAIRAFELGADSVALGHPIVPDDGGPRMRANLSRIIAAGNAQSSAR